MKKYYLLLMIWKIVAKLIENKKSPDLEDFVQCVENYTKSLDSTIELMTLADMALQELIELKK